MGAGGSETGCVAAFGEGGGSGAEGSWIGAVTRRAAGGGSGAEGPGGGRPPKPGATGAVASRGWVVPAPGRARKVMRTVSFFRGTAEVFGEPVGTAAVLGVGGVLSASLIKDGSNLKKMDKGMLFSGSPVPTSIPFSEAGGFSATSVKNPAASA